MIALILAYALVSFGVIMGKGIEYQLLNLTGSVGLLIDAASRKVAQLAILNIFWALVGIVVLIHMII